jgi:hypothetical protein
VPTLFDACREAGRSSVAVVGDQCLIGTMGAKVADRHWPPDGVLSDDVVRDGHGFVADGEVLVRLRTTAGDLPDLLFAHLNEPDTYGHVFGPDSPEALAGYRSTDATLGAFVAALQPRWDDLVMIVVSDHDQETIADLPSINLYEARRAAPSRVVPIPEGGAAVVWGDDPSSGAWLEGIDGIAGHAEMKSGVRLVWGDPGRWFELPRGFGEPEKGQHGGATTRAQVAAVGGGHPAVADVADAVRSTTIDATSWAPTIASLLGLSMPSATGRSII